LIEQNVAQARYLGELINADPHLELLAPISLNVVRFRFKGGIKEEAQLDAVNKEILLRLQESGVAAPSSTRIAPELSIIEELLPAGTSEVRHSHVHARQFFFVLEGKLTLEVEHHHFVLQAGEGIEVSPGQQHQALNRSATPVRMIVTSQPPSHGDRIIA